MQPLIATVKARFMREPASEPLLWAAWNRVVDRIEKHALALRPKPKVFEVHHLNETARKALLQSFAAGNAVDAAETAALEAIKL